MHLATYRKTTRGDWVAMGDAQTLEDALHGNTLIAIIRASGSIDVRALERVGSSFDDNGERRAYAYLAPSDATQRGQCVSCQAPRTLRPGFHPDRPHVLAQLCPGCRAHGIRAFEDAQRTIHTPTIA